MQENHDRNVHEQMDKNDPRKMGIAHQKEEDGQGDKHDQKKRQGFGDHIEHKDIEEMGKNMATNLTRIFGRCAGGVHEGGLRNNTGADESDGDKSGRRKEPSELARSHFLELHEELGDVSITDKGLIKHLFQQRTRGADAVKSGEHDFHHTAAIEKRGEDAKNPQRLSLPGGEPCVMQK